MVDIGLQDGDLPVHPALISGVELIRQRIDTRIRRWLGEWFLDNEVGLLRIEWLTAKPASLTAILGSFETEIRAVPGVRSTLRGDASLQGRELVVSIDVLYDPGGSERVTAVGARQGLTANSAPFALFFGSRGIPGAAEL